MHNGSRK
jgi:hypothetical protein